MNSIHMNTFKKLCVCVCVFLFPCISLSKMRLSNSHPFIIYLYLYLCMYVIMYIYICVCVCVSLCRILGVFATAVGQLGVNYLIKKYKRSSYVVMSIGAVVALSAALMGLESVISVMKSSHEHDSGLCGAGE